MSLRTSLPEFNDTLVCITSGRNILNNFVKPLLQEAETYYKISSFFSPSTIHNVLQQLSSCFLQKRRVRLVIGIHDSTKLIPTLNQIDNANADEKFKIAVQNIITKGVSECLALIERPGDFLFVFSELIKQELIEIKIAAVKKDYLAYVETGKWPEFDSTFHPKVSIFQDATDTVVMSGSINSTNKGFGGNVDEASFIGSWFSSKVVLYYKTTFDEIWNGMHAASHTFNFNSEIKEVWTGLIQNSQVYKQLQETETFFSSQHLYRLINDSPLFYHYSFKQVRLLPHQIAVYKTILSRWPVVGLIADEVGLGKTIEAGAVIKYLKRFFSVNRIALLVPSSLRYQWQAEMYNLFGLEFYIYDGNSKSLTLSKNNEVIHVIQDVYDEDLFDHGIENIILSWHYIRLRKNGEFKLNNDHQIDLIVVDEAHAARLNGEDADEQESTLLYQFLNHLLPAIPHKLLLTATPFQTNALDYVALLRLLMANNFVDEHSLGRIARLNLNQSLFNQQKIDATLELVNSVPYQVPGLPREVDMTNLGTLFDLYDEALYIENHPTTIYTVRNTRDKLTSIGYKFPAVELESQAVEMNGKQGKIFKLIQSYIDNNLFSFETSMGTTGMGFAKIIYQQRIVSSIKACYDTLSARLAKLRSHIQNRFAEGEIWNNTDEDDVEAAPSIRGRTKLSESQISIAESEISFIREILTKIEKRLIINGEISDPKIDKVLSLVDMHLTKGNKIIIFSRFTSTTDYIVNKMVALNQYSVGRYQGNVKEYIKEGVAETVDRDTISAMFKQGEFPVIVCSDAASEGLNLQSANVIINVDVPWNPARLLQRFGRIDRFGQQKPTIFFHNLFYPNTVEDHMYCRLHRRNKEFREILGMTPNITSERHIRELQLREVMNMDPATEFSFKNSLIEVSKMDNIRMHEKILLKFTSQPGVQVDSQAIYYGGKVYRYSFDETDSEYLDLNHPVFNQLKIRGDLHGTSLYELQTVNDMLLLYGFVEENCFYPLTSVDEILDYLICERDFQISPTRPYLKTATLSEDFINLLSNNTFKFIDPNRVNFSNYNFTFLKNLKLIKTEITASCVKRNL